MIEITAKDNATYKTAVKLLDKKYRDLYGMFLVEGTRAVIDILQFSPELVQNVFVSADADDKRIGTALLPQKLFAALCETENSQGIVAVVKKPPPREAKTGSFALFLDRVRDPGNVGTLIRTALAAGFTDIFLYDCADAYSGKVVRSTMSAIVKVNLIIADLSDISVLKSEGYTVISADMKGQNAYGYKSMSDKICLVIGNEANGLCDEIRKASDVILSLPMYGDVESLNAAVCGSILMYNLRYL